MVIGQVPVLELLWPFGVTICLDCLMISSFCSSPRRSAAWRGYWGKNEPLVGLPVVALTLVDPEPVLALVALPERGSAALVALPL